MSIHAATSPAYGLKDAFLYSSQKVPLARDKAASSRSRSKTNELLPPNNTHYQQIHSRDNSPLSRSPARSIASPKSPLNCNYRTSPNATANMALHSRQLELCRDPSFAQIDAQMSQMDIGQGGSLPTYRDPKTAPLYKLSVDLIATYKTINEVCNLTPINTLSKT